jgi:hypothetical protein
MSKMSKMILQGLARPIHGNVEQDYLSSTCKINQDLCLARLSKIKQDWARFIGKIEKD